VEDSTSKIDQYLSGEMSSEDRVLFEAEMDSDEVLKEEVRLQMKVVAMLDESAWLETKDRVTELNRVKTAKNPVIGLLKIAAIIAVIALPTYIIVHRQFSDDNLYVAYYSQYPDRVTTMGTSDPKIEQAMSDYNNERFESASNAFKELRLAGDSTFIIYEATSLTENSKSSLAVALLEATIESEPANISIYQWQLVLSYLANNEGEKARLLLKEFVKNKDGYQIENAKKLLSDLTSFWR
jgi:hypothetical protein